MIEERLIKYVPKKFINAIEELYHDGFYYCGSVKPGYKVTASDSHIINGETIQEMLSDVRSIEIVGIDFKELEYALECEKLVIDTSEKHSAWLGARGRIEVGYECVDEVQYIVYVCDDYYKIYNVNCDEVEVRKETVIEVIEYLEKVLA